MQVDGDVHTVDDSRNNIIYNFTYILVIDWDINDTVTDLQNFQLAGGVQTVTIQIV